MLTTLEKRDLVKRTRSDADRRRVLVSATDAGVDIIDELFPLFNQLETGLVSGLSTAERKELSRLLRIVITSSSPAED
jgi:DNA-binding MarR family transcriptional regulator